jgi:hypothetical protein
MGGVAVPTKTMVPRHVTPGVQHIVDRLSEVPVCVFSASWDILLVNDLWATLFGETPHGNLAWKQFMGGGTPHVKHTENHLEEFRRDIACDLHVAVTRYPDDVALATLVADLRAQSPEFEQIWGSAIFGEHRESRKTVDNAIVGPITFDCDVLAAPGSDLKIVVYTVVPGSVDAEKLDLLRVSAVRTFA